MQRKWTCIQIIVEYQTLDSTYRVYMDIALGKLCRASTILIKLTVQVKLTAFIHTTIN